MRITVLTPTYNRGGSIQKLYTSLDNQSIKDFEWLIVDDGSLDDTAQVVRKVQKSADFRIRYIYKENGGKHTALNEGIKNIESDFRAPVGTLFICMIVMYAGKKKMPMGRIVFYGLLCIIGVSVLGAIRTTMSGGVSSTLTSFFTSLYVGNININYMYNTFPGKVDFQYGYTYLINFLMLLPGPDLDFTLWLKEQVGITFSGGGLTPTIIGEFYINFGEAFIFIGLFILGVFSVYLNRYFKRHKESFLAVFYVWQFAHCVSGGIANVSVTVLLYTIVYKCLIMLPYRSTKSFNRRRLADGQY